MKDKQTIRILSIEDDPKHADILRKALAGIRNIHFNIKRAARLSEALEQVSLEKPDVILLDLSLPDKQGDDTFERVHARVSHVPIIVVVDTHEEKFAREILRKGAQDYLVKGKISGPELFRIIYYAIERKRSEIALRESGERYRNLFETSRDCIFMVKKNGEWIDVNAAGAVFFGFTNREELLKTNMNDFYINLKDRWDHLSDIERQGYSENYDASFKRKDGKIINALINAVPIRDEETGLVLGYQGSITDVTAMKRMDKIKDEFINMVSHELRTPLTSIREGVSQVVEGILGQTTDAQRQFLSMALEDIDRLRRIIDNLLDVSKIEAGKVELKRTWVDMGALIKGISASLAAKADQQGLKIRTRVSPEKVQLYVDRDKIIQVFINLVGNAIKFTEKGHIEMAVEEHDDYVVCSVSDTGRGIAKEDLSRVFGKFQQLGRVEGGGEKGTGLGLSIAKGIVELHGGRINVQSEYDRGTVFSFRVPKYTALQWFRECVANTFQRAVGTEKALSLLAFRIQHAEKIARTCGTDRLTDLARQLEQTTSESLRRYGDFAIGDTQSVLVMLPDTNYAEAERIGTRIQQILEGMLKKNFADVEASLALQVVTYPESGKTADDLLNALYAQEGRRVA